MKDKDFDEMIQKCQANMKAAETPKEKAYWAEKIQYWKDRKRDSKK
jgi:hypothetical protein